jgi:Heterokaryon incompatibility protein (HET)
VDNARERRFRYENTEYTKGALRLASVKALLRVPEPAVHIHEWPNLTLHEIPERTIDLPKYAAISHVWKPTEEWVELSKNLGTGKKPFTIDVGRESWHNISWNGLQEAAMAARHLKCDYIWLDLLCIEQLESGDKAIQIHNMSKIYESAAAVLTVHFRIVDGLSQPPTKFMPLSKNALGGAVRNRRKRKGR